jgi:hypothetical protein
VDLAADGGEDHDRAAARRLAQVRLLGCEGDQGRRSGLRDDPSRLRPVGPEEVAVVIVVHDHNGRDRLIAHERLRTLDAVVADAHLGLQGMLSSHL